MNSGGVYLRFGGGIPPPPGRLKSGGWWECNSRTPCFCGGGNSGVILGKFGGF